MRVLRYEVPVDDQQHTVDCGPVLAVGPFCRQPSVVEFWALSKSEPRTFRVFGTGQVIPDEWEYRGISFDVAGRLVWHLHEKVKF